MIPITVSIPVGPRDHHRQWLGDCLVSIMSQLDPQLTHEYGDEILLINDCGEPLAIRTLWKGDIRFITNGISLGVAACVNLGVAQANNEHVLLMNSDDRLMPGTLDAIREAWERYQDPQGWYYLNTMCSDGTSQKCASGVAMVCKSHFVSLGGYPPETAVGFPDWMFLSLMQARGLITPYPVSDDFLHWHRIHDEQETKIRRAEWIDATKIVHDILQKTYRKP